MRTEPSHAGESPVLSELRGKPEEGSTYRPASVGFAQVLADTGEPGMALDCPPSAPVGAPLAEPASPPVSIEGSAVAGLGSGFSLAPQMAATSQTFGSSRASIRSRKGDPFDPATRQSAQLSPWFATPLAASSADVSPAPAPVQVAARASLEDLLPAIVRRIAFSGDGRNGSVRLEFGAGALSGGTLVVHADDGHVRVELDAPAGEDTAAWRERIESRLQGLGIAVDDVDVR